MLFLIVVYVGVGVVGWYVVMVCLVKVLVMLVGGVLLEVLLLWLVEDWCEGCSLWLILVKVMCGLVLLVVLGVVLLVVVGLSLFGWVLGVDWVFVGEYVCWFVFYVVVYFICVLLIVVFMVM